MNRAALPVDSFTVQDAPAELKGAETTTASDVKNKGWRGVMQQLRRSGKVLVTNRDQVEGVILATSEYMTLTAAAQANEQRALEELSRRFDARLASLKEPGAGERLRSVITEPAELNGEVIAGPSF